MAKLADAQVSGSCGRPYGFESLHPHQIRTQNRIQEIVSILRFLLPFRGIFALLRHKKHIFDRRSPSSERFCTFGGWAFLLCAGHGTNLTGESPVTGIYRQV